VDAVITVDEMMTAGVKTLSAEASLEDVQNVMEKYNCHHVPIVTADKKLIGLVSQRDVLRVAESSLAGKAPGTNPADVKVADFMTRDVFTVRPETSLRKAAIYIRTERFGCLPVINDGQLVGLITDSDFVNIAIDLLEQLEEIAPDSDD